MSTRQKILLYFSVSIPLVVGGVFVVMYLVFSEYREEEFQQRQKLKIQNTLRLLGEVKRNDEELIDELDNLSINGLLDEKLLIFNANKEQIYASIDDTPIPNARNLIVGLSAENPWRETRDGQYDVVAVFVESGGKEYYGISKAFDNFGYAKLRFLTWVLAGAFLLVVLISISISHVFARKSTEVFTQFAQVIRAYQFDPGGEVLNVPGNDAEVALLVRRFNELMQKLQEAFSFQRHVVHHVSHELKTPIAILVSNLEKLENISPDPSFADAIKAQKIATSRLGDIVNSLLEIAKVDAGARLSLAPVRIDDMVFDLVHQLESTYPSSSFSIDYDPDLDESDLVVMVSERLIWSAFANLLANALHYSESFQATIRFSKNDKSLIITILNTGPILTETERQLLFQHFFRGSNSQGKQGFGLGLVFVAKVLGLHNGRIEYSAPDSFTNIFTVSLPLS